MSFINKLTENKNLKGFKFIFNGKRKGSTPEKNTKQIININSKETHYKNSDNDIELKYKERINQNDSYIPKSKDNNSLKKNINNPLRKTFKEDNIYYNDKFNKLKKVGIGSYCTTKIEEAEEYSGITEIKGQQYKTVLMVRVNPESIN